MDFKWRTVPDAYARVPTKREYYKDIRAHHFNTVQRKLLNKFNGVDTWIILLHSTTWGQGNLRRSFVKLVLFTLELFLCQG